MGQGQADVALRLLRDCSRSGKWLCLKNLHLVSCRQEMPSLLAPPLASNPGVWLFTSALSCHLVC